MGDSKVDVLLMQKLLSEGLPQKDIAKRLGVTPGRITQLKTELKIKKTKRVVESKVPAIIRRELNAADQLVKINEHATWILDHMMAWCRGDQNALEILAKQSAQKLGDPYQTALKAMAEVRSQLKLQLEIFQALYDMEAAAAFQQEVVDILGEVDPDVKTEIVRRLKARQALHGAVGQHPRDK